MWALFARDYSAGRWLAIYLCCVAVHQRRLVVVESGSGLVRGRVGRAAWRHDGRNAGASEASRPRRAGSSRSSSSSNSGTSSTAARCRSRIPATRSSMRICTALSAESYSRASCVRGRGRPESCRYTSRPCQTNHSPSFFPGRAPSRSACSGKLAELSPVVRATFDEASKVLGYDLWQLVAQGPADDLNATERTQPAMLAAGIATLRLWRERGGAEPGTVTGHSLGEFTALVAAGAIDFGTCVGPRAVSRPGHAGGRADWAPARWRPC